MISSPWQTLRRVVPRWRSLSKTLESRELASPPKKDSDRVSQAEQSIDFLARMEMWSLQPSLMSAAELVESAIVEGRERTAINAARRLVAIDVNAAPLIRAQAARLLERNGFERDVPEELRARPTARRGPRAQTRLHPRDPLSWVELALYQTIRGHLHAAERSMLIALDLAPNNRHVLRSASRLFLHNSAPDRAHSIIARSDATKRDPWLMAAEIALSKVADKNSRFLKIGGGLLDGGGLLPRQSTELASAVGTEDLVSGNRKKARKNFLIGMADPTGNSAAQAEWAVPSLGSDIVSEDRLIATFENAEAMAFHQHRLGRFEEIAASCAAWADDDPFSIRPFEFGSAAASNIGDYDTAIAFASNGLEMRRNSTRLINTMIFSQGSKGNIEQAKKYISIMPEANLDIVEKLVFNANKGLIAFRDGNHTLGRALYNETIDGFRRQGQPDLAARAGIFLAREILIAGGEGWKEHLKEAGKTIKKGKDLEAQEIYKLVERLAERTQKHVTDSGSTEGSAQSAFDKKPEVRVRVSFDIP